MTTLGRRVSILLVEDNPGDVEMVTEAIDEWNVRKELAVASDGTEAMKFLRKEPPFSDVRTPDLILLDLNLPRRSGMDVLEEVKCDPDLRLIPVIVLTSSASDQDLINSFKLHANCYILKPASFDKLVEAVKAIECLWFKVAVQPPKVG